MSLWIKLIKLKKTLNKHKHFLDRYHTLNLRCLRKKILKLQQKVIRYIHDI